jgi:hypothetical protein
MEGHQKVQNELMLLATLAREGRGTSSRAV